MALSCNIGLEAALKPGHTLNKSLNQKRKVKIRNTIIKIKKRKLFYEK